MNSPEAITIRAGEREAECRPPGIHDSGHLDQWLSRSGFPLNTRCGRKGLCHGCEVEIDGRTMRACQCLLRDFDTTTRHITIPERSLQDGTLDGVSLFEINRADLPYHRRKGIGLAIDIGTTTIAAALWDLATGQCLAHATTANAQRRFGDNVLTRIDFASGCSESSSVLQKSLVEDSLNPLIRRILSEAGHEPEAIGEAVATGNTVMLHSLVEAELSGFHAYPFKPVFLEARTVSSSELGIEGEFPIFLPPGLGAFVGADISAGIIASGLMQYEDPMLYLDVGTNGEMALITSGKILATATAAGPAFEGGRLRCGAPARPGVIGQIDYQNGQWLLSTIGDGNPRQATGISGAAYINFLALGRTSGCLSSLGRLDREHPAVSLRQIEDEEELVVALTPNIFVSEADIAELMQAKAAILAGAHTLLEESGLEPGDLAGIIISGGFGYYLNPQHAIAIGLIPHVPADQIHVVGNASLAGASLLLQCDKENLLNDLNAQCRLVELNQVASFEDHFIDAMNLDGAALE